jgi:hypothetical protein
MRYNHEQARVRADAIEIAHAMKFRLSLEMKLRLKIVEIPSFPSPMAGGERYHQLI